VSPEQDAARLAEVAAEAKTMFEYELGVFDIIGRAIGFDAAMYKRNGDLGGSVGLDSKIVRACDGMWRRFSDELVPVAMVALRNRRVAVDAEVLGRRLERQQYYQRFMGLHGGRATAIVCLTLRGGAIGTLALGRVGAFRAAELEYLRAVAPTLSLCESAMREPVTPAAARAVLAPLTPREREVLAHLQLGYTNAQIATALGSAERTVRNQLSSINEKLGVSSRAEAAALHASLVATRPS
jgi:DNA-binding CsgD family transcriptional regulator